MAPRIHSHSEEEESEPDSSDYDPTESTAKPFARIWSEDQELAILKGVIEFNAKGIDFASKMEDFYYFMKTSLDGNFTKTQLASKLQKLRRKFKDNLRQKEAIFSLHEKKLFRLSKRIWGAGSGLRSFPKYSCSLNVIDEGMDRVEEREREKLDKEWTEVELSQLEISMKWAQLLQYQIGKTFQAFTSAPVERSARLRIIGEGMDLVTETNDAEFEEKRKEIVISQLKLNMKKAQLAQRQIKMILDACKSSSFGNQK